MSDDQWTPADSVPAEHMCGITGIDDLPELAEEEEATYTIKFGFGDDPAAFSSEAWFDFTFDWQGSRHAQWSMDICGGPDLSPASSSPVYGLVSWYNGSDLILAHYSYDLGEDGCARITGAAPTDEEGFDPRTWLEIARVIMTVLYDDNVTVLAARRV